MARTTSGAVQGILGGNYDSATSLVAFIDTASSVVDQVVLCAARKNITLGAAQLELIERWLAAHYYTRMDPTYTSRSTAGASGSFTSPKDDPERYRQSAIEIDTSGCLSAILNSRTAKATWLGKPPSDQIPIDQRD